MYCVWQVVKTPTIISNNTVFVNFNKSHYMKLLHPQKGKRECIYIRNDFF